MNPVVTKSHMVCFITGEIYFKMDLGMLYCLNTSDGTPVLSIPTKTPLVGEPLYLMNTADQNEWIFTTSLSGELIAFNLTKKEIAYSYRPKKLSSYALVSPVIDTKNRFLMYQTPKNGFTASLS